MIPNKFIIHVIIFFASRKLKNLCTITYKIENRPLPGLGRE